MNGVLADFMPAGDALPSDARTEYTGHLDDVPGIFANMNPLPGAIKAFEEVCGHCGTRLLSTTRVLNRG